MTPVQVVYDAFLAKMLDDEWDGWTEDEVKEDMWVILQGAIPWFKFPRVSLEVTPEGFTDDLSNDEVQILATYMVCEWLRRTILTWENVKPLYAERDFSQANLIDKFNAMLAAERKNAQKLESLYYRSVSKKSFAYRKLASQPNNASRS